MCVSRTFPSIPMHSNVLPSKEKTTAHHYSNKIIDYWIRDEINTGIIQTCMKFYDGGDKKVANIEAYNLYYSVALASLTFRRISCVYLFNQTVIRT